MLWQRLSAEVDAVYLNGPASPRLANNLNVRFDGVHGEALLKGVASEIALSSGAACATASAEPSHVLRALGLTDEQARASLRFGLSRFTTTDEVDRAVEVVCGVVKHLRR